MASEITLDFLPGGYAINAVKSGEFGQISYFEFVSSEDGQELITKLEGLPDALLARLPPGRQIRQSQVDHLLGVVRRDLTATVYVNELPLIASVRASRAIEAGAWIGKDDIADIVSLDLGGVSIPDDTGIVFVCSFGWRRGLFYDLEPLLPDTDRRRTYDLRTMFGQLLAHLVFQERFSILEAEWDVLFANKWFPFVGLSNKMIEEMLTYVRAGWPVDELTGKVLKEVKEKCPSFLQAWEKHPTFGEHIPILRRAVERFQANDPVSCTGLVFPRIEGLMRSNHSAARCVENPGQANLSASAVREYIQRDKCLLLPHMFRRYLESVYFASFNPSDQSIGVSRNSVGHGVADASKFDEKAAAIGLLVTHQLFYCFEQPKE